MKILTNFSPNHSRKKRGKNCIKFVIIHYTGMQSEIESIRRLKNQSHKVSCHYLINRKGEIIQMVRDHHIAWHAGKSRWKEYVNLNNNSLGIELVNKGHQYGYQNFTNKQINSLIKLCNKLKKKYFVKKENFLGHSDIAPLRKNDPGEKFPWKKLSSHNIGKWYVIKPFGVMINSKKMKALFFSNIKKLGYRYCKKDKKNSDNLRLVKSFQQHYLPKRVTGRIDKKTYKISHFLAN